MIYIRERNKAKRKLSSLFFSHFGNGKTQYMACGLAIAKENGTEICSDS